MVQKDTRGADEPVHLFDQTNGVVDFDPGDGQASDAETNLKLLEKGAASNIVNGFGIFS